MNPEIAEREIVRPAMEEVAEIVSRDTGCEIKVEHVSCSDDFQVSYGDVVFIIRGVRPESQKGKELIERIKDEMEAKGFESAFCKVINLSQPIDDNGFFPDLEEWRGELP